MPRSRILPRWPDARRRGLTLIEVLVILGILAFVIVLFLPAISYPRSAARRAQCINNLKQIALALHNYAEVWGGFPASSSPYPVPTAPGFVSATFAASPQVALIPYLEQGELYNAINFHLPMADLLDLDHGNSTVARANLSIFICPSDEMSKGDSRAGSNSYRASLGPCAACPDEGHGAFRKDVVTPLDSFVDGTAHTIAFAERSIGSTATYDPKRDWLDTNATARLTANEWVALCSGRIDPNRRNLNFGRTWMIAGGLHTHFFTALPPNSPTPDCGSSVLELGSGAFTARSQHPGGANVALGDGSVRFVKSSIALATWRALGTRDGGEPLREADW